MSSPILSNKSSGTLRVHVSPLKPCSSPALPLFVCLSLSLPLSIHISLSLTLSLFFMPLPLSVHSSLSAVPLSAHPSLHLPSYLFLAPPSICLPLYSPPLPLSAPPSRAPPSLWPRISPSRPSLYALPFTLSASPLLFLCHASLWLLQCVAATVVAAESSPPLRSYRRCRH